MGDPGHEAGSSRVTAEQLEHLHREGFLLLKNVLPRPVIQAVQEEIDAIVDEAAEELYAQGRVKSLHKDLGYLHRFTALQAECAESAAGAAKTFSAQNLGPSADMIDLVFRRFGFPEPTKARPNAGNALFDLMTCEEVLGVMETIFRIPEVCCSGVYRLRPKLPDHESGIVPWHQDQCFFLPCSDPLPSPRDWSERPPVITCWIPLMDATKETGCMEYLAPAQKTLHRHYMANLTGGQPDWTIHPDDFPDEEVTRVVQVPAMTGDIIVFSSYAPHRSTTNTSGLVRWAVDLRYSVPASGDYNVYEAGFLARSVETPEKVIRDYRDFARIRTTLNPKEVRATRKATGLYVEGEERRGTARMWKRAAEESFRHPTRKGSPFEGDLEFQGRLKLHEEMKMHAGGEKARL